MEEGDSRAAFQALAALAPGELRRRLPEGLIIDLDDTLNVNHSLFLRSRAQLVEILQELAPERDPYELGLFHRDHSNSLIPQYGFTPTRWRVGSLEAAALCAGRELEQGERERVLVAAEIGVGVGELYPYVAETLALLKHEQVPMLLLTKGEQEKQAEKIAAHELELFFDEIVIVEQKDAALLRTVAAERGWAHPVVIGDSEKSDVLPAQEAGFDAVLVDRGAPKWIMERHHDSPLEAPHAAGLAQAVALLAVLDF
jgi:putative hydrolase of the HAD superfamily